MRIWKIIFLKPKQLALLAQPGRQCLIWFAKVISPQEWWLDTFSSSALKLKNMYQDQKGVRLKERWHIKSPRKQFIRKIQKNTSLRLRLHVFVAYPSRPS